MIICVVAFQHPPKREPKFESPISQRAYELEHLKSHVYELSTQVDILQFRIDYLKSGQRSGSRSLWHKFTQLGFQFSQLTRLIRTRLRIRSTSCEYRRRQQAGTSSPSLERSLKDEDEKPEEQQGQEEEPSKSGNSENESEIAHQHYLRKGNAAITDTSSSEQLQEQEQEARKSSNSEYKEGPESSNKFESESAHERYLMKGKAVVTDSSSKQHQEKDCVEPPESIDEIAADQLMPSEEVNRVNEISADQLMLSEEVDLLLDEVRNLKHQALDLSKEPVNYEERAQTRPNMVAEWYRSGITNTVEPRRLFFWNLDIADKVICLRSYVEDLQPVVYLQSQLKTCSGGWRHGCFKQSRRSSPPFGRVRETL